MAQPVGTPITCPSCRQPFSAILEQIIDVGNNPQAKLRLLNGELNVVACPHCGFVIGAHTPLIYHDASKELLIVFVPMELNLSRNEQEMLIGKLQNTLINSLPPEKRKGYMFTPKSAFTMQSLVEQVLEADGFTQEMREAHKARLELIDMLLETPAEQRATTIEAHDEQIDAQFLQTLAAVSQLTRRQGNNARYEAMTTLYDELVEHSTAGHEVVASLQRQGEAMTWAQEELNALGEGMTREQLLDLALEADTDEDRLQALVGLTWPFMDYQFFQVLTARLEASADEAQERLDALRDRLLELTSVLQQQNRAVLQQAANTLREIMQARDIDAALRQRQHLIDDVFMAVLSTNIQAAEQAKDLAASARLKQIYARVVAMIQEQSPPEVRFINSLLMAEDDTAAEALIREQTGQLNPEVLELIDVLIDDLRDGGQQAPAERLTTLREKVAAAIK